MQVLKFHLSTKAYNEFLCNFLEKCKLKHSLNIHASKEPQLLRPEGLVSRITVHLKCYHFLCAWTYNVIYIQLSSLFTCKFWRRLGIGNKITLVETPLWPTSQQNMPLPAITIKYINNYAIEDASVTSQEWVQEMYNKNPLF